MVNQLQQRVLQKEFGDNAKVAERVTAEFKDGKRTVFDNVVVDKKTGKVLAVNETKTGNADFTKGQSRYYEKGEPVKFVGEKAEKLGIKGESINAASTESRKTSVKFTD